MSSPSLDWSLVCFGLSLSLSSCHCIKMDPALLREREAFKKKALANPTVESRKRKEVEADVGKKKKKKEVSKPSPAVDRPDGLNYKLITKASLTENFTALTKIIRKMKERFKDGDAEALTLEELLEETNQVDLSQRHKNWLVDALSNNVKVEPRQDGRFAFKPTFSKLRDSKSILRLLDEYDRKGKGGILLEEIEESLPRADKYINKLGDQILLIVRPVDKKKVVFYNEKSLLPTKIDEEFQKLWRSVTVDSVDETKIEEYLEKQGLATMQDLSSRKSLPIQKRKKVSSKKGKNFKKTNTHVSDILQDYSDQP